MLTTAIPYKVLQLYRTIYVVCSKIGYHSNNWASCFWVIVSVTWRPYNAVQTLSCFLCFKLI